MSDPRRERARAGEEAASWFARLSRRSVTTEALREFRDWRRTPANADAYATLEQTWSKAGDLADDPDIRAATRQALDRRPRRLSRRWMTLAWAAPLATAAIAAAVLLPLILLPTAYDTGVGEQRLVVLQDGSRVRLNTDSRVTVRFTKDQRRLALTRGEAFFEVAHDAARPFTVDAGQAEVRALGTRFDVRREAQAVQVTLVEGSVRVRQDDAPQAWTLAPSQQLTVARDTAATPKPADTTRLTSWTTGRLMFHETPLAEAVAEVNRYAPHKLRLEAPALADRTVSGVFDTGDTEAFVAAVTTLFPLEARPASDESITLRAPGA